MMSTPEALAALGVTADLLSAAEREALDKEGFVYLYGILSPGLVQQMGKRLLEIYAQEGEDAGKELGFHLPPGDGSLADLVNKDSLFDICYTHPKILAAASYVLNGDLKLSSLNYRAPFPGHGLQGLHADWDCAVAPGDYKVCNSIWLLDDFTSTNGATRVVPGSHRWRRLPQEELVDTGAAHRLEVKILAPAGTVVVFNAHLWHGGTRNNGTHQRRAMHAYFCRRDQPQQLNQKQFLRPQTAERLSAAARYILDA